MERRAAAAAAVAVVAVAMAVAMDRSWSWAGLSSTVVSREDAAAAAAAGGCGVAVAAEGEVVGVVVSLEVEVVISPPPPPETISTTICSAVLAVRRPTRLLLAGADVTMFCSASIPALSGDSAGAGAAVAAAGLLCVRGKKKPTRMFGVSGLRELAELPV